MKLIRLSVVIIILALAVKLTSQEAKAQTIVYQDNFDHGKLTDWYVARNQTWGPLPLPCMNGVWPSDWHIEDGLLSFFIDGTSCVSEIVPTKLDLDQIDNYQIDFDWVMTDSTYMDRNMVFRWKDPQNWYGIKLFSNDILLQKASEEGNTNGLKNSSGTFPFEPNGRYHFSITMTEDFRVTVSIDGQQVIDSYDKWPPQNNWDNKKIAFQASAGGVRQSKTQFDNLVVRSLDDAQTSDGTHLAMPHFKQNDPLWASEEYDHAASWSQNPTIDRWGCAITAMTMVLHYYEMTLLPDGTALTPSSLNTWLNSQADGYLGQGLTNWLAITRLTRLISEEYGTPKLEYHRAFGSGLTAAQSEITQHKPVILQIAGHFLTGAGLLGENDLAILDPLYAFSALTQHGKELLSTIMFKPSFTDLSYLLITHNSDVSVKVKAMDGTQPANIQIFEEFVQNTENTEQTQKRIIQQIAKPIEQHYTIEVSQPNFGPFEVEIIAYDTQANPTILSQSGFVGATPISFTVFYHKTQKSELVTPEMNFTTLRQNLKNMFETNQIRKRATYTTLDRILAKAESSPISRASRYISSWEKELTRQQHNISQIGYDFLTQQTSFLKNSLN